MVNMMKNNNNLNLKNKQAFKTLEQWANEQSINMGLTINFHFSPSLSMGSGFVEFGDDLSSHQMVIGTSPLSQSIFSKNQPTDDLTFVKLGVTTFHELSHVEQHVSANTPKAVLLSDLSKHGNNQYYKENWNKFPFEIDAEYVGVTTTWSYLKELSPTHADHLMLEHLTDRAERTIYMIKIPDNGFQSKEQIESLFEEAYDWSLDCKRNFPLGFLRFDDEISKLLTVDRGILDRKYEPFYRQLMMTETGEELDLKMASLVSYLHPELQTKYPKLDFITLYLERIFGIPMPETREEIKDRIGMRTQSHLFSESITCATDLSEASFSESVARLTDLMEADAAEMSESETSFF